MIIYYTKKGKFKIDKWTMIPFDDLHRKNNPAYVNFDKNNNLTISGWFINGKLHRESGPAIVWKDGARKWYINGKLHRLNGPAVIWKNEIKKWLIVAEKPLLYRRSSIQRNNNKEYWINGQQLDIKKVNDWIKNNKVNLKTKAGQIMFMLRFG